MYFARQGVWVLLNMLDFVNLLYANESINTETQWVKAPLSQSACEFKDSLRVIMRCGEQKIKYKDNY